MNCLNESVACKLEKYQLNQIETMIQDFLNVNKKTNEFVHEFCPKCGIENPKLTKGGTTSKGKQMVRCGDCKKRFVVDSGQLTFYSQQSQSSWNDLMLITLAGSSLEETAAKLNVHVSTAFRMRHKFMNSLKFQKDEVVLTNIIELDELYVLENRKGQKFTDRKSRKRGESATKRGLSKEQVCIITAIERDGNSYIGSYNNSKPSVNEIRIFAKHIADRSYVLVDKLASYNVLRNEYGCTINALNGIKSYDIVNHLNNVNSLHSRIRTLYRHYRGISSKYINRYNALFSFQYAYRGMDSNEKLILLLNKLRGKSVFFYIRDIKMKKHLTDNQPMISGTQRVKSPIC